MSNKYEILGIGAPVIDHIIRVDESFVEALEGGKGGMVVVDYNTVSKILSGCKGDATLLAGGSSANTLKGLAELGHHCAFQGRVGEDPMGQTFLESLSSKGVLPLLIKTPTPTAQALCLVTPDGQRTMRTFLGASAEMCSSDLTPQMFTGIRHLHLEGYNLLKGDLTETAMRMAKEVGATISLDLASHEIVNAYKKDILRLIPSYVDIVIANADEALALTELSPEQACKELQKLCSIAIVLFGEGGCWVGQGEKTIHGKPFPADAIDTTGAGDLFASGFIHSYLAGKSIEECARFGNITGSAVVEVLGAEIPPVAWERIHRHQKQT